MTRLPPSRLQMRRRRRRRIFIGIGMLVVAGLLAGIIFLMRASFLRIQNISVSGEQTVSSSTLADFLREDLRGTYALVLPKNNIFLYSKNALTTDVISAFPSIRDVSIHALNLSAIAVSVEEREPFAQWCGQMPATSSPCLLLDSKGVAYAAAPHFSSAVYISYFGVLPGVDRLPAQFLTSQQFASLSALAVAMEERVSSEIGALQSVYVDENNDVHLVFAGSFTVLFGLSDDAGTIFNHFSLALSSQPFVTRSLSNFQYLDLRFGEKLYYKLK